MLPYFRQLPASIGSATPVI
jgi:hypothetical protein